MLQLTFYPSDLVRSYAQTITLPTVHTSVGALALVFLSIGYSDGKKELKKELKRLTGNLKE